MRVRELQTRLFSRLRPAGVRCPYTPVEAANSSIQSFPGRFWGTLLERRTRSTGGAASEKCASDKAIFDSGASRCLFHSDLATHLGIDYTTCPTETTTGIGGNETTYLHDLSLYIPGGPITIKAGFKQALPVAGLLGMNGFFAHFKIVFDGPAESCTLERVFKA